MVPRQEQWIRAQRLANRGMINAVQPQSLISQRLSVWLRSLLLWYPLRLRSTTRGRDYYYNLIHAAFSSPTDKPMGKADH